MHQQLGGYKVEEKLYLVVREQKTLNAAAVERLKMVQQFLGQHFSFSFSLHLPRFSLCPIRQ
jgi:hypothetical protein